VFFTQSSVGYPAINDSSVSSLSEGLGLSELVETPVLHVSVEEMRPTSFKRRPPPCREASAVSPSMYVGTNA